MPVGALLGGWLLLSAAPGPGTVTARDMVAVPAGWFLSGSDDRDADPDERPRHRASTRAFEIDRTEVTRADYARCVAAGACQPATAYPDQTEPTLPQTGVSFHDAVRYCRFVSKRLPTELEWEKAARGTDGRRFPWGDTADCARANYGTWAGEGPCAPVHPGRPEPVGRYPQGASPYGALDLAGNVWEWVDALYPGSLGRRRVLKGGSCCSTFLEPRAANRVGYDPDYRDADIGFRCVRSR
ncbi:MAG TPA: SUMF1/EgtB/PvdO family nonheme iron enzyme [Polyangia bacterium]|nr:SUMF1/EgtB/PvdO family nonheme iron enzyme [Polyangia bacterium]